MKSFEKIEIIIYYIENNLFENWLNKKLFLFDINIFF